MKARYVSIALCVAIAMVCSRSLARAAAKQTGNGQLLATVDGQPIYQHDLVGPAVAQLARARQQQYKLESEALDALIRQKLVENEAKKQGISVEKLYEKEVDSKVPEPSDDEARGYYLALKGRTTLSFEQLKPQVKRLLKNAEIREARAKYADSLRRGANVAVYLQPPAVELGKNDPARIRGNPKAPITIVEFGDFQCPFCGRVNPTLAAVLKKYHGKVKLAFRDFPLSAIHPHAEIAAEAGRCAEAHGKFWPMHDAMYADQSKLTEADLVKTAGSLGMNEKAFSACLKSGKYKDAIQQDVADGSRAGVTGTPTFFINGRFLSGSVPEAQFDRIIDSELLALKSKSSVAASR